MHMEEIENKFYFQSIEDFILLVGTSVAFIAFILWCCFPIEPKDSLGGSEHLSTQVVYLLLKKVSIIYLHCLVNEDHCRQVNVPNFGEHNLFKDPLIFNKNIVYIISKQYCSINVKTAEEAYYLCICLFRQRTQFTMLNTSS